MTTGPTASRSAFTAGIALPLCYCRRSRNELTLAEQSARPPPSKMDGVRRKSVPDAQAFLTHAEHQPLAVTSLPWKMVHGPSAAPALPEYWLQLAHGAVLSVRLVDLVASIT